MDWPARLKVAIGTARGLAHLHSSSDVGIPIVHRDFKSTKILPSDNYEAKIFDFGLAKLMPEGQETHMTSMVLGTFGHFESMYIGRRSVNLTKGLSDQNLVLQVRHMLADRKKLREVIDPELSRSTYLKESIAMFADLASRCVRIERPTMIVCVKQLHVIIYTNLKASRVKIPTSRMF